MALRPGQRLALRPRPTETRGETREEKREESRGFLLRPTAAGTGEFPLGAQGSWEETSASPTLLTVFRNRLLFCRHRRRTDSDFSRCRRVLRQSCLCCGPCRPSNRCRRRRPCRRGCSPSLPDVEKKKVPLCSGRAPPVQVDAAVAAAGCRLQRRSLHACPLPRHQTDLEACFRLRTAVLRDRHLHLRRQILLSDDQSRDRDQRRSRASCCPGKSPCLHLPLCGIRLRRVLRRVAEEGEEGLSRVPSEAAGASGATLPLLRHRHRRLRQREARAHRREWAGVRLPAAGGRHRSRLPRQGDEGEAVAGRTSPHLHLEMEAEPPA